MRKQEKVPRERESRREAYGREPFQRPHRTETERSLPLFISGTLYLSGEPHEENVKVLLYS